ncbi:MAG: ABC transporter substrate-binding protein [Geminicoccaceae bacterium]
MTREIPMLSRRHMLACSAGAVTIALAGPSSAEGNFSLEQLDRLTADRARSLTNRRDMRLRLLIPEGSQGSVQPVIAAFKQMSDIDVELVVTAVDDINTKLMLDQMVGSDGYDLALPATFGIPELAEAGALADISALAARYEPKSLRDASLFTTGDSYDGRIYGFQADGDAYLMFYNKPWLDDPENQRRYEDQFGAPLAIPATWQELDRQMAFFHRPENGRYGGALFRTPTYVAWEWWIRYHAQGAWPFDAEMNPLIDGEAGILALEALVAASEHLYPEARHAGLFDNWEAYADGNIYCNIGWGGTQKYLNAPNSKMRGKLAFSLTPGGIVDGQTLLTPYFNWGWNYVVASKSREPEIAYLFALFASSPRQSARSVGNPEGYFDPHRPEHYRDDRIVKAYSKPFLAAHEASMRGAVPDLYLDGHGEYFGALSAGIISVLERRKSAAVALNETAKRWAIVTHRLGKAKQQAQWQALRSKYPTSIANRLKPSINAG